jgi:predicted MFS family arabinose efflux permease
VLGAILCALGLAGPVYALIRQPSVGWGSPEVLVSMLLGIALFAAFLVREARTPYPMLPLGLFRRRNFAFGNIETFAMYGGLSAVLFFLVLFLQQVAGYDALQAGLATLPITIVMFMLSRYAGRLADRYGPRWFMGFGPLVAAVGLMMLQRVDAQFDYFTDLFPALLVFSLGLSATVAPLTATVLADADENNAGIASGVNNAIARVAQLLAVAVVPVLVGITGDGFYVPATMTHGFHLAMVVAAALSLLGGVLAWFTIRSDALRPEPERQDQYSCPLAGPPPPAPRADPART